MVGIGETVCNMVLCEAS